MGTILDRIIETKRTEVAACRARRPLAEVQRAARAAPPPRDFYGALAAAPARGIHVIAEIKKRSPSAGLLRADFDPAIIARAYHDHGASAISVLTDGPYFEGRLEFIEAVRAACPLPVLRKDFILDAYQVHEARAAGADAVLLIGEVLSGRVPELAALADDLGMTTLIEVHEAAALAGVLETVRFEAGRRRLLGVNNRNLRTQQVDLATTERLARQVPGGTLLVAESGIRNSADVRRVIAAGARAILVGEMLMRAPDVGAALDALLATA